MMIHGGPAQLGGEPGGDGLGLPPLAWCDSWGFILWQRSIYFRGE